MLARWSVLALLGLAALPSQAASVLARVFFDANGNGQQDRGEVGAPQVLVSDGDRIYRTDASGEARLEVIRAAHESARVFVISPGGHRTTTPWHEAVDPAAAEERAVLFGLQPVTVRAE
ncbi:MAG: hypothetical protein HUU35_13280, partial [Armatimonadetes bacterium]|nr:hypothetical protein [Armatimonadota bacterium]